MVDFTSMPRNERMKYRRNKLKLSPSYVAKYIGISRVAYIYWEDGSVSDIGWNKYRRLAKVLLTTVEWIEHGTSSENYTCNDSSGDITKNLTIHIVQNDFIPILGSAYEEDLMLDTTEFTEFVDMPAKSDKVFALRLTENNKLCKAHSGDALIIDPTSEALPGEEVYVTFNNKKPVICNFNYLKDNKLNCNTDQGKENISLDDINYIYPIVAVARNGYIKKGSKKQNLL